MARHLTSPEKAGYQASAGVLPGRVEMPTFLIAHDCLCSWSVSRPAPGVSCLSALRHASLSCPHYRDHVSEAEASAAAMRARLEVSR